MGDTRHPWFVLKGQTSHRVLYSVIVGAWTCFGFCRRCPLRHVHYVHGFTFHSRTRPNTSEHVQTRTEQHDRTRECPDRSYTTDCPTAHTTVQICVQTTRKGRAGGSSSACWWWLAPTLCALRKKSPCRAGGGSKDAGAPACRAVHTPRVGRGGSDKMKPESLRRDSVARRCEAQRSRRRPPSAPSRAAQNTFLVAMYSTATF